MAATATKIGIEKVSTVMVVTKNTDEAIDFYVEKLGFEKTTDTPFGPPEAQMRWVEVSVPGAETTIALAPPPQDYGEVGGAQTGIALSSDDIDATHAALKDAGVDVDDEVSRMGDPVPPMFWFRDPEGNSLMVVELSD
jgi:catechol 2,3-dioxygenase-like lactoylglutathione lyase family enzyme